MYTIKHHELFSDIENLSFRDYHDRLINFVVEFEVSVNDKEYFLYMSFDDFGESAWFDDDDYNYQKNDYEILYDIMSFSEFEDLQDDCKKMFYETHDLYVEKLTTK